MHHIFTNLLVCFHLLLTQVIPDRVADGVAKNSMGEALGITDMVGTTGIKTEINTMGTDKAGTQIIIKRLKEAGDSYTEHVS